MSVCLFTFHAYGSWLPDRDEGFVKRRAGVVRKDLDLADRYREKMSDSAVVFDSRLQQLMVDAILEKAMVKRWLAYGVATDSSHVHLLVGWQDESEPDAVRKSLKTGLTRALNRNVENRTWFSRAGSRKIVKDQVHFDYLITQYLPSHRGVCWFCDRLM